MIRSGRNSSSAWRNASFVSTLMAVKRIPPLRSSRSANSASEGRSSTIRMRRGQFVSMVVSSEISYLGSLIKQQPIKAKGSDRFDKLVKIHRLDDITVHA